MNIRFSLFILKEKYSIEYPNDEIILQLFELGSLRNCLVHYDGELSHYDKGGFYFEETLSNTLESLNLNKNLNKIISINEKYLNNMIFGLKQFISNLK